MSKKLFYYGSTASLTPRTIAFIAATGISDDTIIQALNTMDLALIAAGLDTKMLAVYPFVGGTATTHKYNFMDAQDTNSANRLTFAGGWTHSSTGILPNGTNARADTYLNPSIDMPPNSTHISYYSRSNATTGSDQIDMGCNDSAQSIWLSADYSNGFSGRFLSRNTSSAILANSANAASNGFYISTKRSNAVLDFSTYKNGVSQAVNTGGGTLPTITISIGALNVFGLGTLFYTNRECAFSSIGSGLTDGDATTFNTIVSAFQTALGR